MTNYIATCGRCGIQQQAKNVVGYICGACSGLGFETCAADALPPGQWVQRGCVWHYVADPEAPGQALIPEEWEWDDEAARRAHAAFVKGDRDDWAREGERWYQRSRRAAQRASKREREKAA